ncbi:RDD family protein [candidate division WOR-3 bacterium]|nr:RDD family protein [candidate division WOR-3 bacterium]
MKRKFIPRKIYQAFVYAVLAVCLLTSFFIAFKSFEPHDFFTRILSDERGHFESFLAFLFTFLFFILASFPFLLFLRIFSDAPSMKEGFQRNSCFTSPSKNDYSDRCPIPHVWSRIFAFIIDRSIAVLILMLGIPLIVIAESAGKEFFIYLSRILFFCLLAVAVFYSYARDAFGGRSVGRRILKMRVIDVQTGNPINWWKSFLREICLHAAPLLAIEIFFVLTKPDRRRTGDFWAKSIVVKDICPLQSFSRLSS